MLFADVFILYRVRGSLKFVFLQMPGPYFIDPWAPLMGSLVLGLGRFYLRKCVFFAYVSILGPIPRAPFTTDSMYVWVMLLRASGNFIR